MVTLPPTAGSRRRIGRETVAVDIGLNDQYVFFITAPTGNRKAPAGIWGTTTFVGSVTVDGAGNITGGVDDMASPAFSDTADQIRYSLECVCLAIGQHDVDRPPGEFATQFAIPAVVARRKIRPADPEKSL